jgi:hypothetical protein
MRSFSRFTLGPKGSQPWLCEKFFIASAGDFGVKKIPPERIFIYLLRAPCLEFFSILSCSLFDVKNKYLIKSPRSVFTGPFSGSLQCSSAKAHFQL